MARRVFDMDSVTEEIGFGKYEFFTFWDIMHEDIDYTAWLKAQPGIVFSETLSEFIREVYKQYDRERADGRTFQEIYDEYLEKEHYIKENRRSQKSLSSDLESKLNLLNSLVNESHKEQQRNDEAQRMWLSSVIKRFENGDLEEDTISGKIRWHIDEKNWSGEKRKTVYGTITKRGIIYLRLDSVKKEDGKWYTTAAFLSEDKKLNWQIPKKDIRVFKYLLDEIRKNVK